MNTQPVAVADQDTRSAPNASAAAVDHKGATMNRIAAVTKLHFVNPWTVLAVPAMILVLILLMNITIWWLILSNIDSAADRADARDGFSYSGASLFIFVYMMVVAVQAMNLTFPFALGYGVTRREFYIGSAAAFVILSAIWAVTLTVLASIETATGGWGLGGRMFSAVYFGTGQWYQQLFLFFAWFVFFFFVGAAVAALYVRWKTNGLLAFFAALAVLLVGGLAIIIRTDSWGSVGQWFAETGTYGLAAWSLVPAVLSALAGYAILQRATPKG